MNLKDVTLAKKDTTEGEGGGVAKSGKTPRETSGRAEVKGERKQSLDTESRGE